MASRFIFLPAGFQILGRPAAIHLARGLVHLAVLAGMTIHHFLFPLFVSPWLSVSVYSLCAFMLLLDGARAFFSGEKSLAGGGLSVWDWLLFVLEALFFFSLAFILGPGAAAALLILLAVFFETAAFSLYGGWRGGAAFALSLSLLLPLAFLLHGLEPQESDRWRALLALLNFGLAACVLFGWLLSYIFEVFQLEILEARKSAARAAGRSPLEPNVEMSLRLARKIKPALNVLKGRLLPEKKQSDNSFAESRAAYRKYLGQLSGFIERFIEFAEPLESARFLPLDLRKLLEQAVKELKSHPDHPRGLESEINYSAAERIEGAPDLLKKAFENILINSFQALRDQDQPRIKIRVYNDKSEIVLEFWDNGHGIEESDRKALYDPLFSKNRLGMGRGLGLAVVQKIVKYHRGSLDAQTVREKKGTVVRIKLPLLLKEEPSPLAKSA